MRADQTYLVPVLGFSVGLMMLFPPGAVAQPAEPRPGAATTPWGDPDLQGIWNHGTITPLERPREYDGREELSPEEVAALNEEADTRADRRDGLSAQGDIDLAYNAFWWDRGVSIGRTSLIIDPADGRLPPRTATAQAYLESPEAQRLVQVRRGRAPAAGPEDMDLGDRCLVYRPVPIISSGYNNHVQIAQSPGYVAILQEQIHEVRIIPLDRRPHVGPQIKQWLGDSRGHWEGNTLVVETTNFSRQAAYLDSHEHRHVVERFTRVGQDRIDYEFTVTDPTTWTRAWTAHVPWRRTEGPIYEYACHEGNYGMFNLLAGARIQERAPAETVVEK